MLGKNVIGDSGPGWSERCSLPCAACVPLARLHAAEINKENKDDFRPFTRWLWLFPSLVLIKLDADFFLLLLSGLADSGVIPSASEPATNAPLSSRVHSACFGESDASNDRNNQSLTVILPATKHADPCKRNTQNNFLKRF